jgi:hypothetical protein
MRTPTGTHTDAREARTLAEFAPRYEKPAEARGRTVPDIIVDALAVLHQDAAEYAFAGLIGAIAAAFVALVLPAAGGPYVGAALIAPAVFTVAAITYANTCAAVRRSNDNLEPDAVRAFFAVLTRLPAIMPPLALPLAVTGGTTLAAVIAARWAPNSVVTLAAIIVFALAGLSSFQRSLHVPALFARGVSFGDARLLGAAAMRKAGPLVGACFVIAMAPAGLITMGALAAQFSFVATAIAAFVFVASMPVAAAIASLIFDGIAPQVAPEVQRRQREAGWDAEAQTSARLSRQYAQRRR